MESLQVVRGTANGAPSAVYNKLRRRFQDRGVARVLKKEQPKVSARAVGRGRTSTARRRPEVPYARAYALAQPIRDKVNMYSHFGTLPNGAINDGFSSKHKYRVEKRAAIHEMENGRADSIAKELLRSAMTLEEMPEEVRIKKRTFPTAIAAMTVICSLLLMFMIFNFAKISDYTSQISAMEKDLSALTVTEEKLSLQLEERYDIREVEQIASGELGMVRADIVPSKFVSMLGGDKIELYRPVEETEDTPNLLSALFSSIGDNFEDFMEYIN